jgi:hypothetical protein
MPPHYIAESPPYVFVTCSFTPPSRTPRAYPNQLAYLSVGERISEFSPLIDKSYRRSHAEKKLENSRKYYNEERFHRERWSWFPGTVWRLG